MIGSLLSRTSLGSERDFPFFLCCFLYLVPSISMRFVISFWWNFGLCCFSITRLYTPFPW